MSDDKKGFDSVMFDDILGNKEKGLYLTLLIILIVVTLIIFVFTITNIKILFDDYYGKNNNDFPNKNFILLFYSISILIGIILSSIIFAYITELKDKYNEDYDLEPVLMLSIVSLVASCIWIAILYYSTELEFNLYYIFVYMFIYMNFIPAWMLIAEGQIREKKEEEITTTTTTTTPQIVNQTPTSTSGIN